MSGERAKNPVSRHENEGTVDPEGNRVGFFGLPNDQNLRQEWLVKIDDDPHFKLTEATKVCSSVEFSPKSCEERNWKYNKKLVPRGSSANISSKGPSTITENN